VIARRTRREQRAAPEPEPPAPAPAAPGGELTPASVLALQQGAGNAAVGRLLQRHEDHGTAVAEPEAGPAAAPAAPAAGQAAAEAIAAETVTRIDTQIQEMAKDKDNATVRNTAGLFAGASPRLRFTPMTPRSDSETIRTARGQTAGSVVYFFTGTTQPALGATPGTPPAGTLEKRPTVVGTIQGDTVVIRGQSGGAWRTPEDLKGTLIHEGSHILLKSYGEHPGTSTDASSFDRYKDEFRAYFVEQFGSYAETKDLDKRAAKIKRHLVGDSLADTRGYPLLRTAYWTPPVDNPFRVAVDAHKRPDGFNLTNSIRLDRLFTALDAAAADPSQVDEAMVHITRLTPAEREEAKAATLVKAKTDALGADDAKRIRAALDAPTHKDYTGRLNPSGSGRIARLYEEIARGGGQRTRDAYDALKPEERGELQLNPGTMVFVDHNALEPRRRACVYAMLVGRSSTQYEAMENFLDECFFTHIGTYGDPPAGLPDELRAAVRKLTFYGRLSLYRSVEDARKEWVDSLPAVVSKPLLAILRGDADP